VRAANQDERGFIARQSVVGQLEREQVIPWRAAGLGLFPGVTDVRPGCQRRVGGSKRSGVSIERVHIAVAREVRKGRLRSWGYSRGLQGLCQPEEKAEDESGQDVQRSTQYNPPDQAMMSGLF